MFEGLSPWLNRPAGPPAAFNVVGCGIFAAACGSSAATMATVGRISLPELDKRGYDRGISLGSLASPARLGIMIPPSITFIVYGVTAGSVDRAVVRGRHPARNPDHGAVHGLHRDLGPAQPAQMPPADPPLLDFMGTDPAGPGT